jgi:hypothetical protein
MSSTPKAVRRNGGYCVHPDEVARSGGESLEVLRYYAVTSGWQPWDPGEARRDELPGR